MENKRHKTDMNRLARECAKLNPQEEKKLAEELMHAEVDFLDKEAHNKQEVNFNLIELASKIYEGLSAQEINDIEKIAFDRSNFFRKKPSGE